MTRVVVLIVVAIKIIKVFETLPDSVINVGPVFFIEKQRSLSQCVNSNR